MKNLSIFIKLVEKEREKRVVKKGRRRKRNSERNFDNFFENNMILRELKYDFKNKKFSIVE